MSRILNVTSSLLLLVSAACGVEQHANEAETATSSALEANRNSFGIAESFHTTGTIDFTNPMFLPLGTNARSCATCHAPDMGWTLTATGVARLFRQSDGLDPLFMPHDEGSRPDADLSTEAGRRAAFGPTLLELGLTRFTRTIAATSEFTVLAVEDPSGFSTPARFLNFRRRPQPPTRPGRRASCGPPEPSPTSAHLSPGCSWAPRRCTCSAIRPARRPSSNRMPAGTF
jgi:cytochrome c peroxidase